MGCDCEWRDEDEDVTAGTDVMTEWGRSCEDKI